MGGGPVIQQQAEPVAPVTLPVQGMTASPRDPAGPALVQGVTRMADKDQGAELPQRVPGTAQVGPVSPVAPPLSEELRQRMQQAVRAERAEAAADEHERAAEDRTIELPGRLRPSDSAVSEEAGPAGTSSPANGTNGKRNGAVQAEPTAVPEFITGPAPEDFASTWLGSAVKPRPAVRAGPTVKARTAEPERAVRSGPEKPRRRARARLITLGLAVMVIGSLAAVAVNHFSSLSPGTVRSQAAAWVAEQVSPDVTVSCDPVMCSALQAHGFPVSKLVVLGPTTPEPVPSVLLVETATVRELFGSSLAIAWAPAILASFGSGTSAITVRVVAPHGEAGYRAALNAGLADRKTSGAALLRDSQITVSATARSQLLAGQVDSRLLLALASLARHEQIDIVRFGNLGPGASPVVPLRFADLAENIAAAHMDTAAYARALWAILSGADAQIRPAGAVSGPVQGQAILRVEFTAPSPLGNVGSGTS
jgi:hypothetical protein